jgi:hypothetical protein
MFPVGSTGLDFSTREGRLSLRKDCFRCKAALEAFISDQRAKGRSDSAIFSGFLNTYGQVGSRVNGALELAERIKEWDPEYQAKLRAVGLRSSYELDWEEGRVFIAFSPDHPIGAQGRRSKTGELCVTQTFARPLDQEFPTIIENIKRSGAEPVVGPEADELLTKLGQVEQIEGGTERH